MAVTMNAVNLDIYLTEEPAPRGYVAKAVIDDGRDMDPKSMNLAELLDGVRLTDIYRIDDQPPAMDGSAFVKALIQLRDGFIDKTTIETVGVGLLQALPTEVVARYNQVWGAMLRDRTRLLRVRLHFDKPELGMLPWEYMKVDQLYLCEHPRRSLIRFPSSDEPIGDLEFSAPLKVLIWAANPPGTEPLAFKDEVDAIHQKLKENLTGTAVQLDLETTGDAQTLFTKLENGGYHVLHYIGHGRFDPVDGGVLEFQPSGAASVVTVKARQLQFGLIDNPTLKLVFLNSCETAVSSVSSAYTSLGQYLARFTPTVIAMQKSIPDSSAVLLAQKFYEEFSANSPIDVCLARGRHALIINNSDSVDWGIPVLFTRADLQSAVPEEVAPSTPAPAAAQAGGFHASFDITSEIGSGSAPPVTDRGESNSSANVPSSGGTTPVMDGSLRLELVNVLGQAFSNRADLAQLTDFYLNQSLDDIRAENNTTSALLTGIVRFCLDQGGDSLARLMDGAIQMRPKRDDLKTMRARLVAAGLITSAGPPASGGGSASQGTSPSNGGGSTSQGMSPSNGGGSASQGTPLSGGQTTDTPANTSSIEPPPVAVFSNGRLSLTPQGRRKFTQTIAMANWASTAGGRDDLLKNLPQGLRGGVSRSDTAQLHISSILSTAESWGKMTGGPFAGKYALIVLADTAADLSGFGTDDAREGADVFMELANAMRDRVGQAPAAMPFDN